MTETDPVKHALRRVASQAWGIALGGILGLSLFSATIVLVIRGGEDVGRHLGRLGIVLPGYDVTVGGALLGLVYGFVIGYALGRLLAPREGLEKPPRSGGAKHVRLRGKSWGLALGLLLGVTVFAATVALVLRGGENVGALLSQLHVYFPGYSVSFPGALIGAAYALALGWLLGNGITLIYNVTVKRAES